MRLAVLSAPESWYFRDLARAAGGKHELVCLPFSGLSSRLGFGANSTVEKPPFDAVMVRSMPPGSLEQVIFRMDVLGRWHEAGVPVINPPKALEAAIDKYLASAKLAAAGLLTPRTLVCQTVDEALSAFADLGGDVVLKPLFGSEGRGLVRLSDEGFAERTCQLLVQLGAVLYLQEFIPHAGHDLRLFVLDRQVFGMRRENHLDWRTNVSRGAATAPFEVTDDLVEAAQRAAAAVGAPLAGVDFLPGRDGRLYALEVNAVPGWRALARTLKIDIAERVLQYVESLT